MVAAIVTAVAIAASAESTTAAPVRLGGLSDIPSHNGLYRASMMARSRHDWAVQVRTAAGVPVDGAVLSLEASMPGDATVSPVFPTTVEERDSGEYTVDGMQLERQGWWNIRVTVSSASGTDSLAFNLIR
jgi:hypothetical protein